MQIYNQILKMIKQMQFPPGSKLPSEEVLSSEFNVSRVTLRTALSLLKEDGVIQSIHGQGHFVVQTNEDIDYQGIEVLESPVSKSLNLKITDREVYYHDNKGSEFTDKIFGVNDANYLTLNIWYKNQDQNIANNLSILLPETVKEFGVDLSNKDQFVQFLEKDIYKKVVNSRLTITISDRPINTFKRKFAPTHSLILMTEDLYGANGLMIAQNKYYIPSTLFRTTLMRYPGELVRN
ncbi:transcriptional regulator, GntR family [Lentilactobacillus kisonensis DSM 19906 = JCM 15041]|uniref:Transcriptional regulator, GntR family n=1 Tax=Lentilactobacillus kisonensis DSM 19906 = JCM 15041 TaxID=1423766 RepID=A0A0R1NIC3_9LACO|nr:transcriptional regulator, GntR family [Lentilactobacillus kisonensis DSM 19906 = JCM 15041]